KGNNGGYPGNVAGMQTPGFPNQDVAGAYEGYGHKGNNGGYPGSVAGAAMNGYGMAPYAHKGNEEYPEAVMGAYGYPNQNLGGMMMPPG
ncbi:hypothetical protein R0J90_17350, partial [Micrococcus sp. SIMBA_144]